MSWSRERLKSLKDLAFRKIRAYIFVDVIKIMRLEKKNAYDGEPVLHVIANFMVEDATGLSTINSSEAVVEFWGRPRT